MPPLLRENSSKRRLTDNSITGAASHLRHNSGSSRRLQEMLNAPDLEGLLGGGTASLSRNNSATKKMTMEEVSSPPPPFLKRGSSSRRMTTGSSHDLEGTVAAFPSP